MSDDALMWSEGLELNEQGKFRLDLYGHLPSDSHFYDYEICAQSVHIVQRKIEKEILPGLGYPVELLCSHSKHTHKSSTQQIVTRYNTLGVYEFDDVPAGYQMIKRKKQRVHAPGAESATFNSGIWFPFDPQISQFLDIWISMPQHAMSDRASKQNFEDIKKCLVVTVYLAIRKILNVVA